MAQIVYSCLPLRNNSDGIHLFLEDLKTEFDRLSLDDVDVPLYHMLKTGPSCGESCFKILEYLLLEMLRDQGIMITKDMITKLYE